MITNRVREFRKNPTPSEIALWQIIRNRQINGHKFRRQHPIKVIYQGKIRYFIADFYCCQKKLVIEVDGKIHENQREYDQYRTFLINQLGIKVMRINNEELNNIAAVTAKIESIL